MVKIGDKYIWAYDTGKTPQEIRKMWDEGLLDPNGHYGDFATHVVHEIHHLTHRDSWHPDGGFLNLPHEIWINDTLGIKYDMTMMTGSHFVILDDKLTPTFETRSMDELEKFYCDVPQ